MRDMLLEVSNMSTSHTAGTTPVKNSLICTFHVFTLVVCTNTHATSPTLDKDSFIHSIDKISTFKQINAQSNTFHRANTFHIASTFQIANTFHVASEQGSH